MSGASGCGGDGKIPKDMRKGIVAYEGNVLLPGYHTQSAKSKTQSLWRDGTHKKCVSIWFNSYDAASSQCQTPMTSDKRSCITGDLFLVLTERSLPPCSDSRAKEKEQCLPQCLFRHLGHLGQSPQVVEWPNPGYVLKRRILQKNLFLGKLLLRLSKHIVAGAKQKNMKQENRKKKWVREEKEGEALCFFLCACFMFFYFVPVTICLAIHLHAFTQAAFSSFFAAI